MNIQRIQWKVPVQDMAGKGPDDFFAVFSSWIPDSPEIFVDVSDYKHVQDGVILWLAGHYVSYSLDNAGGSLGLLSTVNRPQEGTNQEKLARSLEATLRTCRRIEEDPRLAGVKFDTSRLQFFINDRAIAPNTAASFAAAKPELEKALGAFFAAAVTLKHLDAPRQRFGVQIEAAAPARLAALAG